MSDTKQYPTRMHEVLGVEVGERFKIEKVPDEFFLNHEGRMIVVTDGRVFNSCRMFNSSGDILTDAINHGIIRRPRLSEEQVAQLKALVTLGGRWLAKDETGDVFAYGSKPQKMMNFFFWNNDEDGECFSAMPELSICSLVSWSDPEPLDIVKTLRDAGVEVE